MPIFREKSKVFDKYIPGPVDCHLWVYDPRPGTADELTEFATGTPRCSNWTRCRIAVAGAADGSGVAGQVFQNSHKCLAGDVSR